MTDNAPVRLLLLSGGGHTAANVMATLATRRHHVYTIATSDVDDEPSLFTHDVVYLAPSLADDPAGFSARIDEIIEQEAPDLIIGCRDADVVWLSQYGERHPRRASLCLCGNASMAATVNDKWLSHEFCREFGLPFAPSLPLSPTVDPRAFLARHGFPVVVKPRDGADSRGILLLSDPAQVERARSLPHHVVQQYLGRGDDVREYLQAVATHGVPIFHSFLGDKRSIQVLIAPDGDIEHVACTRNAMTGRISRTVAIDRDPEPARIGLACAAAFSRAGWRGVLNIQCQPDADGRLLIHEFNARFTGATAARWLLGVDEVGAAVRRFTGRTLSSLPAAPLASVARESLAPRAAMPDAVALLARTGCWRRNS